jgi:hypothetical protein
MRVLLGGLLLTLIALQLGVAQGSCLLSAAPYQLASDTVNWSMTIGSGQSCIRGLRGPWNTLDSITLLTPPEFGQVAFQGPGLRYTAKPNYHGQDFFAILLSGEIFGVKGKSTVQVVVSVK